MALNISSNKLLIVEGSSDKALFVNLLANRNLEGFDVICPWDMGGKLEGEDSIKQLLDSLPTHRNFDRVEKIIIVVDADNDAQEKFKKFKKKIISETEPFSGSGKKYPVPNDLNTFATSNN